jgi:5-formyltetrahydrofolate cyclo-ligase
MNAKKEIRNKYKKIRKNLSNKRKKEAEHKLLKTVVPLLKNSDTILSFYSTPEEICTHSLNEFILSNYTLLLPKIKNNHLEIYKVENLTDNLIKNSWGIKEPNPKICIKIHPSTINVILVPGLAFDENCDRIGYGKGFYDKFISQLKHPHLTYGLAFKEQKHPVLLPNEPYDIKLNQILFF